MRSTMLFPMLYVVPGALGRRLLVLGDVRLLMGFVRCAVTPGGMTNCRFKWESLFLRLRRVSTNSIGCIRTLGWVVGSGCL